MSSFGPRRRATAGLLSAFTLLGCSEQNPTGNADSASATRSGPQESIPKLVETRVTSGRSGCGMSLAIGMDDPEFLLNRGTERREVAIAE